MKKSVLKFCTAAIITTAFTTFASAQTITTFEDLTLPVDSFWNGSTSSVPTTFTSGNAIFPNSYNVSWDYWESGWAYSNVKDSTTFFPNLYGARPATGYNNSANYVVGQQNSIIKLTSAAIGGVVNGCYITNGTYAAISMRDGDTYARKFGDTTGTGSGLPQGSCPDWFKLTIKKYSGGALTTDSVEFYLADYRFANDSLDYIVKTWEWVDLTSLGNVDSLLFTLSSSDVGILGMNTPAFFCMDNFITADNLPFTVNPAQSENATLKVYPNPASQQISINLSELKSNDATIKISDVNGKVIYNEKINSQSITPINISGADAGVYFINIISTNFSINRKFIKQ